MRAALIGFAFLTAALGFPIASHATAADDLLNALKSPASTQQAATPAQTPAAAAPTQTYEAQVAALQALVLTLTQQLNQLLAQKAALMTAPAPANTPAIPTLTLTRNLSPGSRGTDVTQLQEFLIAQKLLAGDAATGFFGELTQSAVQTFQRTNNIVSSGSPATSGYGSVGPRTRAAMAGRSDTASVQQPGQTPTEGTAPAPVATPSVPVPTVPSVTSPPITQPIVPITPTPPTTTPTTYAWQTAGWSACVNSTQSRSVSCKSTTNASVSDTSCTSGKPPTTQSCTSVVAPASVCTPLPQETRSTACPTGQTGAITEARTSSCPGGAASPTWSVWTITNSTCTTPPPATQSCTLDGLTIAHGASQTFHSAQTVSYGALSSSIAQSRTCTNGTFSGSSTYRYANCASEVPRTCSFNGSQIDHGSSVIANLTSTVPFGQQCQSQARTCTNGVLSGTYTYAACSPGAAAACLLDGVTVSHNSSYAFYSSRIVPYGQSCSAIQQSRTCQNGALGGNASYQYGSCTAAQPQSCTFNNQTIAHGASISAYQAASVAYGQTCAQQTRACTNGVLSGSYTYAACTPEQQSASCTFNGQQIAHGASVPAYQSSTVPAGQQCVSQQRTCSNGVLSGTYTNAGCTVATAAPPPAYPNFKVTMQPSNSLAVNIEGFTYVSEITPIILPNPKSGNTSGTEKVVILPRSSSRICTTSANILTSSVLIPQSSCYINATTPDLFKEDTAGKSVWTDPSVLNSKPWTYSYDGIFTAAVNQTTREIFFGRVFENQSYVNRWISGARDCSDPSKAWTYPSTILPTTKTYCTCAEQEYKCAPNEQSNLCVNGNNICPADLSDVNGNIHSWPTYTAGLTMGASSYNDVSGYAPQKVTDYGPIAWPQQGGYSQAGVNIGWPAVIVKDDYLYLFSMMSPPPAGQNGGAYCYGLMRSPLASGGKPGSWRNYVNGSFSSDPLPSGFSLANISTFFTRSGGTADCVSPPSGEAGERQVTNWFHVARIKDTQFYIAVEESAVNWGAYQQVVRFSTDLINWSPKQVIDTGSQWGQGKYTYGRFLNAAGNNSMEIDANEFYLYGKDIPAGFQLRSAKLTIIPRPAISRYAAVIDHYYQQLLNRAATASEISSQSSRMETSGCYAVVQNITQASEFASRRAALSNADFVKTIARAVISRSITDTDPGQVWYLNNLQGGIFTDTSLVAHMSTIPEAVSACGFGLTL